MAKDPRFAENAGRCEHQQEVDSTIQSWTSSMDAAAALALLDQANVAAGPIYDVRDMFADPQFRARGLFQEVHRRRRAAQHPCARAPIGQDPGQDRLARPRGRRAQRRRARRCTQLGRRSDCGTQGRRRHLIAATARSAAIHAPGRPAAFRLRHLDAAAGAPCSEVGSIAFRGRRRSPVMLAFA